MKQLKRILLVVLMMACMLLTACTQTDQDINEYLQTGTLLDEEAANFMPALDALPTYEAIDYRHTRKKILFFEANSVLLNVQYDEQTYQNEKELLAVSDDADDTFSINSYTFWLAESNGFPKSFGIMGTSDEKQSIAYLYFYDFDLDSISTSMEQFVKDYFNYDF